MPWGAGTLPQAEHDDMRGLQYLAPGFKGEGTPRVVLPLVLTWSRRGGWPITQSPSPAPCS